MLWTVIANVHPSSFILNLLYYISSLGFKDTCRFFAIACQSLKNVTTVSPFPLSLFFFMTLFGGIVFLSFIFFYVSYILMYISICPFAERFVRKGDTVRTWLVLQLLQNV